jgi:PAS domain S-box-containing protein
LRTKRSGKSFKPEQCEQWADYYRRALSGEIISIEDENERGCFQIHVLPVRNQCGEIFAGMSMWQDITERKSADKALRESEARFKSAFEDVAVGMTITELDGRLTQANQALCDMLGYTKEELFKLRFSDITHPEDLPAIIEAIKRFLAGEISVYQRQKRYFHKAGHIIWAHLSVSLVRGADGNPLHFIAEIQDITERKLAAEALKESEERYRNLFENAYDLVYIHDLEGNFISVNQAAERVFGYSREEALEINIEQTIAPDHLELARRMMREKIAGTKQTAYEIDCITRDGRRLTLEVNSTVIYKDGAAVAVQGIARDITDRKQAQQAIQRSETEMRAIFSAMKDVVMVFDSKGHYLKIAENNPKLFHKATFNLVGKKLHEVFPQSLADYFLESVKEALNKRQSVQMEYSLQTGDEEHWFAAVASPMTKDSAVVVARNITENKRAEKRLRDREEQYRDLFENANDLIYTHDLKGNFQIAQPGGRNYHRLLARRSPADECFSGNRAGIL